MIIDPPRPQDMRDLARVIVQSCTHYSRDVICVACQLLAKDLREYADKLDEEIAKFQL